MVTKVQEPSKYGVVVSNKEGQIQQFIEKPQIFVGNRINAGIYIFNKEILDRIKLEPTSIERVIFPQMAKENKLYSMDLEGYWMDIGQPLDYLIGTSLYLHHQKQNNLLKETVLISPSAKIGKDCLIGPDVVIGDDVIIGDGVRIKKSVIFSKTKIGSNTLISGSIIGWCCTIGKWNRIDNCTVFGEDIQTVDEIFINGGKVLPHKSINSSIVTPEVIM